MNAYLWFWFVTCLLAVVFRAFLIPLSDYPRVTKYSVGEDVFYLLLSVAQFVWVCILLGMF